MKIAPPHKPLKTIYLISCVSKKLDRFATAKDIYISIWFSKAWKYYQVKKSKTTDAYILSAKHGLLWAYDGVDPYEHSLQNMALAERKLWAERVYQQIGNMMDIEEKKFVVLAGEKYREILVPLLVSGGATVKVPMKGLGIGEQMAFMDNGKDVLNYD